jgi:hypothetical protein
MKQQQELLLLYYNLLCTHWEEKDNNVSRSLLNPLLTHADSVRTLLARSEWIRALYSPYITGTDRRSVRNPDFQRDKTSLTSEVQSFCLNISTVSSLNNY